MKKAALAIGEKGLGVLCALATSIFLARTLQPDEIGAASIALALVALMHLVRDMGVTTYICTKADISEMDLRQCIGASFVLGCILFVVLQGLSFFAGNFYRDERVGQSVRLISFNFLIIPFAAVITAVMTRKTLVGSLFFINVGASLVYAASACLLAMKGAGHLSVIYSANLSVAFTVVSAYLLKPSDVPRMPVFKNAWRIFSVSSWMFAANISVTLGNRIAELALGRLNSLTSSAIFEKGQSGAQLPTRMITDVVSLLTFSKIRESLGDVILMKRLVGEQIHLVVGCLSICGVCLIANADDLIDLLYGVRWRESAAVLKLLAVSVLVVGVYNCFTMLLQSLKLYRTVFHCLWSTRVFMLLIMILVFDHTPYGAAWAILSAEILTFFVISWYARSYFNWRCVLSSIARQLTIGAVCIFIGLIVLGPLLKDYSIGLLLSIATRCLCCFFTWALLTSICDRSFYKTLRRDLIKIPA